MKTPKEPKRIKVNFPPPAHPPVPKKKEVPDFKLHFSTPDKVVSITVPNDQMPRFAEFFQALLNANGITCHLEETKL